MTNDGCPDHPAVLFVRHYTCVRSEDRAEIYNVRRIPCGSTASADFPWCRRRRLSVSRNRRRNKLRRSAAFNIRVYVRRVCVCVCVFVYAANVRPTIPLKTDTREYDERRAETTPLYTSRDDDDDDDGNNNNVQRAVVFREVTVVVPSGKPEKYGKP